jgi:hypothetical protein
LVIVHVHRDALHVDRHLDVNEERARVAIDVRDYFARAEPSGFCERLVPGRAEEGTDQIT